MGKFKKGDRIIVDEDDFCGGYKAGDEFEVIHCDGEVVTFIDRDGDTRYLRHGSIKHVPAAEATGTTTDSAQAAKPKFKVGDRFRRTGNEGERERNFQIGFESTVKSLHGCYIRDEDDYGHSIDNIELLPTQLTIRPGRYYRTRDGRKVGPMRRWSDEAKHRWEADDDDLPYIWADDGTEIDSDIDDSADLVAEAKSDDSGSTAGSTDNTSTAGFTVPLCAYDDEPGWYAAEASRAYADGYAAGLRAAA